MHFALYRCVLFYVLAALSFKPLPYMKRQLLSHAKVIWTSAVEWGLPIFVQVPFPHFCFFFSTSLPAKFSFSNTVSSITWQPFNYSCIMILGSRFYSKAVSSFRREVVTWEANGISLTSQIQQSDKEILGWLFDSSENNSAAYSSS